MRTIPVPTDFSAIATNALHYAIEMANTIKANLILLHVYQVPVSYTDGSSEEEKPEQTVLLETLLSDLRPEYHFLEHIDVEDAINEFAEKNNLDLVISIPKQHKLVEKIFRKSLTRQLVYESRVPVMCIHED